MSFVTGNTPGRGSKASTSPSSLEHSSLGSVTGSSFNDGHRELTASSGKRGPQREHEKFANDNRLIVPPIEDKFDRFVIREFRPNDLRRLRELNNDVYFAHLRLPADDGNPGGPEGFLRSALQQQKQGSIRTDFYLAIEDKQNGELMGSVMLYDYDAEKHSAAIAYLVDPSYQRIRIATDATIRLLVRVTTALKLQSFYATIDPNNQPSISLIKRLGFNKAGDVFTSSYPANPAYAENFDRHKRLRLGIRQKFEITLTALIERAKKIEPSWKGEVVDGAGDAKRLAMQEARGNRELLVMERTATRSTKGFSALEISALKT